MLHSYTFPCGSKIFIFSGIYGIFLSITSSSARKINVFSINVSFFLFLVFLLNVFLSNNKSTVLFKCLLHNVTLNVAFNYWF